MCLSRAFVQFGDYALQHDRRHEMAICRRDMLKATAAGLALPTILGSTRNVWGQNGSGKKSYALHIGLNAVDPAGYGNWDGKLNGCENDADTYKNIATGRFTKIRTLKTRSATVGNVATHILHAAKELQKDDILLVTYAGHGGQVPDASGDEVDSRDETWCLFDRQLPDDELYRMWRYFSPGVRILVLSDSCHSGTVTRARNAARAIAGGEGSTELDRAFGKNVADAVRSRAGGVPDVARNSRDVARNSRGPGAVTNASASTIFRELPEQQVLSAYAAQKATYVAIDRSIRSGDPNVGSRALTSDSVTASVLLISGCQDDQLSMESNGNGLFTTVLNQVWNNGTFPGDYNQFHQAIAAKMPARQQPNIFQFGAATFEDEPAFTI